MKIRHSILLLALCVVGCESSGDKLRSTMRGWDFVPDNAKPDMALKADMTAYLNQHRLDPQQCTFFYLQNSTGAHRIVICPQQAADSPDQLIYHILEYSPQDQRISVRVMNG